MAPIIVIFSGLAILLGRSFRFDWRPGVCTLVLAGLLPPALQLSFIVNDRTPAAARILAPQAYCRMFFVAVFWTTTKLARSGTIISAAFIYYFAIIGIQETNEAATKHIFDISKINRIVDRIEMTAPENQQGYIPMIKIGYMTPRNSPSQRMFENSLYLPRMRYESMNEFCDVGEINFFLGNGGLTVVRPTEAQISSALQSLGGRRPWPAPDSVYMENGTIVVLLQPYAPGIPVTSSKEEFEKGWPELRQFCGYVIGGSLDSARQVPSSNSCRYLGS